MQKRFSLFEALLAIIIILSVVWLLSTCTQAPKEEADVEGTAIKDNLIDKILTRGVMKVGLGIFVPWSFKDKEGNLVGFEVDVASKLAEDMGVEVELLPTEWSGIIPALLTSKFDVIIGGLGITTERAAKVNYTNPYCWGGLDMVANKSMIPDKTSAEDFNREDVILAVRLGATPVTIAKKFMPKAQLHQFDGDPAVLQDVLNGNAHACLSATPQPAFWAADYPDVLYRPLGGELLNKEPQAFAVRKGDPDAIFYFNAWITDNGDWLRETAEYWFGGKEWEYMIE